jgi:predicted patatin/cPLA2 family phospholipase
MSQTASSTPTNTSKPSSTNALVLEGGGFRGVFTSGVLDVLMERGVWDFGSVWGVSAGALIGVNYVSRQIGRSCRVNLAFRDDRRYMSLFQLASSGNIMSTTFLYDDIQNELDPFDNETFNNSSMSMYAVLSDVVFGRPEYALIDSLPEKIDYVRASASMPVVSKIVEIDGRRFLDGGTTDSVPAEHALECGADRAVVVLTRERGYVKPRVSPSATAMIRRTYADYPVYRDALLTRPRRYNDQRKRLWELERQGRIFVICPSKPVEVSDVEHNGSKLLDLYIQGRHAAQESLAGLETFLSA